MSKTSIMKLFVAAWVASSLTAGAEAQTRKQSPIKDAPLPSGDLLARAPDYAKWTMTFRPPKRRDKDEDNPSDDTAPANNLRILSKTVTKTGKTYFEETNYRDGKKRQAWNIGGTQIEMIRTATNKPALSVYDRTSFRSDANGELIAGPDIYTDYSKTDFPGLGWLSAKTYVGMQEDNGRTYLVFRQGAMNGAQESIALIDLQTRLPVRVSDPGAITEYRFDKPPRTPLILPSDLRALMEKRAKAIQRMTTASPSY